MTSLCVEDLVVTADRASDGRRRLSALQSPSLRLRLDAFIEDDERQIDAEKVNKLQSAEETNEFNRRLQCSNYTNQRSN